MGVSGGNDSGIGPSFRISSTAESVFNISCVVGIVYSLTRYLFKRNDEIFNWLLGGFYFDFRLNNDACAHTLTADYLTHFLGDINQINFECVRRCRLNYFSITGSGGDGAGAGHSSSAGDFSFLTLYMAS